MLEGWGWEQVTLKNEYMSPGSQRTLLDIKGRGWLASFVFMFNSPYAELHVIEDDFEYERISPYGLYTYGLTSPWEGIWCSKYDTSNNIYTVVYTPTCPPAFTGKAKITLYAAARDLVTGETITSPLVVYDARIVVIKIVNEEQFGVSFKNLVRG